MHTAARYELSFVRTSPLIERGILQTGSSQGLVAAFWCEQLDVELFDKDVRRTYGGEGKWSSSEVPSSDSSTTTEGDIGILPATQQTTQKINVLTYGQNSGGSWPAGDMC